MDSAELLATLAELKKNWRNSSEIAAAIDPLRGQQYNLKLVFGSVTRTLGNRFDSKYDNGYTATCKTEYGDLEISVMFPSDNNPAIEGRASGDTFAAAVTLLDFDALYRRAILGHSIEEVSSPEESAVEREPEEIPKKTVKTRAKREDSWELEPLSKVPATWKIRNIALAATSFLAVMLAASQELSIDSATGWIAWALLIYPVGLGLPCLANRSWTCLFLALSAFVFDVTGTFFDYKDDVFTQDDMGEIVTSGEMDFPVTEEAFKRLTPGRICYHVAMTLQAVALLGLAISLKRKTGSRWCLVMAVLFAGFTFQFIQFDYFEFGSTTVSQINPAFAFLIALSFCCWAIIRHEIKLLLAKAKETHIQ